ILFVAPRQQRMLKAIERATRQTIERFELPSTEAVNERRVANFKQKITDALEGGDLSFMQSVIETYQQETEVPPLQIAAALARMALGDRPLLMKPGREKPPVREPRGDLSASSGRGRGERPDRPPRSDRKPRRSRQKNEPMERFRLEVGQDHGVQPGNIVGAIANEAGIDASHIGHIEIFAEHSVVELPTGMPRNIFADLRKAWVVGRQLNLSRLDAPATPAAAAPGYEPRKNQAPDRRPPATAGESGKTGKSPSTTAVSGKPKKLKNKKNKDKKPNKDKGKKRLKKTGSKRKVSKE
ncbi:MAG: DbpA RNA binding domain-containing protein, partial [Pseudomonadales bacterium]|nr:DbpA RNA binding domain-containing protein [Pseudomonadales bacterium]